MGPIGIVPGEALAEDTRFELVRGCPQHAFQACSPQHVRAGLPGQGQEALDPAEVQLCGERDGDDRVVDVGREDLPLGPLGGGGAREGRTARQQRPYVAGVADALGVDGGPVAGADDPQRVVRGHERRVGAHDPLGGGGVALSSVDADDPAGEQSLSRVRSEGLGPAGVPAVDGEQRGGGRGRRSRRRRNRRTERQGGPFTGAAPALKDGE
ncbi:hypothetical protein AQF52_6108 [Streptomyces venezuelae]|nr:hypothetical protein AQF52_6108 [Streptomyces venezuelae]CUM37752.1 hypothetical protein BN2537_4469 [Streptomyces venezuelae]